MRGAQEIAQLAIKLGEAALLAHDRGDAVNGLFFAIKAAECLQLAKALGWNGTATSKPSPLQDSGPHPQKISTESTT